MAKHEHEWTYVTDAPVRDPLRPDWMTLLPPDTLLARFCTKCDLRQTLTPTLAVAEISQQNEQLAQELAEAREYRDNLLKKIEELALRCAEAETEQERLQAAVDRTIEQKRELRNENAEARALLEWLLPKVENNEWLTLSEAEDDKAAQRESYRDREDALAKIRAFLAKGEPHE